MLVALGNTSTTTVCGTIVLYYYCCCHFEFLLGFVYEKVRNKVWAAPDFSVNKKFRSGLEFGNTR